MTVTVKHSKTNAISDWTQAQLDEQIALGNFPAGTTLANIVLPSDWNNDHTLTGVGTMAEQNANSVAITGGSVNGTTIGATTASTGKFTSVTTPSVTATTNDLTLSAISTGNVNLATLGGTQFKAIEATGSVNIWNVRGGDGSTTSPRFTTEGTGTNIAGQFNTKGTGALQFFSGNTEQMRITNTASAVNYVQVTGAATGAAPTISAQGSDAAVDLTLNTKSTGTLRLQSNSTTRVSVNSGGTVALGISASGGSGLQVIATGSQVNFTTVLGSITGQIPTLSMVNSSDTNVGLGIVTKGTGAIDLAAGSSGVNISNGGTVTAVTLTNAGTGYTSFPTATIAVPTTAGGVQGVVSFTRMYPSGYTISSGGTGYTAGDVLTIVGGTAVTTAAQLTVSTVSSGVITAVTVSAANSYTALPTNPVSVTGGTGTGATFNLTYSLGAATTISNAGSGYIEQPTITFSGGGGSGAAAYATVGSVPIIRSLAGSGASGSSLSFYTPAGESVRINDQGVASSGYVQLQGASATSGGSYVTSSYQSLYLSATGGQQIAFFTNGQGQTRQFNVAHTASAVNYVQVTGATTGNRASISAQGSDSAVGLNYVTKSNGVHAFYTNSNSLQVAISHVASPVNYIDLKGSIATASPVISTAGSDTNIDLALTPKGTGVVRFGTYTANMALTVQGYIEIKDSGGTLRKLAVIA